MLVESGVIVKWRKKSDGRLLAPHRGRPPVCPDGYEKDPKDKWICLPILPKCRYRQFIKSCQSCGGKVDMHCRYFYRNVNWKICVDCDADPENYGARLPDEVRE